MKKIFLIVIALAVSSGLAETLFEVKDASDHTVLDVSTDGIRVLNYPDTLMVISTEEIKAVIDDSKVLSRKFSVTTSSSKKGTSIDLFKVDTGSSTMREGTAGERYTDFSPSNMFLGLNAGINTTGVGNVFIGNDAGSSNTVTDQSTYIGDKAGMSADAGGNTFVGFMSGFQTTGGGNTFYGVHSGASSGDGTQNNIFGSYGGFYNTGDYNSIFGRSAGSGIEGESNYNYNCLFGNSSGNKLTTGSYNVMIGSGSGGDTSTGFQNVFLGHNSGDANTTGQENVYIGSSSAYNNSTGNKNIFIGDGSGYYETGSERLYIENSYSSSPLIYGEFDNDLLRVNGDLNVTGAVTLDSILTVNDVTMLNDNPLYLKSSSSYSGLMYKEYWGTTYVNGPTLFGYEGGALGTANGAIALTWDYYDGNVTIPTGNLKVTSGILTVPQAYNTSVGTFYKDLYVGADGKFGYLSSSFRYKKNIVDMEDVSWLFKLRPVNYSYKTDETNKKEYGLIAEEVEKINPDFVSYNLEGSVETVNYSSLITPMLKAMQDQQEYIKQLEERIELLEKTSK